MRKMILTILIMSFSVASASQFGQYQFNQTSAIHRQIQTQKAAKIYREAQMRYYQNPTRNIRFPSSNNPYPNITSQYQLREQYQRQRYNPYSTNDTNWL